MRIFISWAKEPSRLIADALRDWLPDVIQSLEPWVSSTDVGAGARWSAEIAQALSKARIGIICVTPENQREPWLLFEAGALAKTLEDTFVCPYLIHMRPSDLAQGPLTQFQAKVADKEGTFDLISTVNRALGPEALTSERLRRLFDRSWPDLEARLSALPPPRLTPEVQRDQSEVMAEVLETVRSLARRIPEPKPEPTPEERARDQRRLKEFHVRRQLEAHGVRDAATLNEVRARLRQLSESELDELFVVSRGPRRGGFSSVLFEKLLGVSPVALSPEPPPVPQEDVQISADVSTKQAG